MREWVLHACSCVAMRLCSNEMYRPVVGVFLHLVYFFELSSVVAQEENIKVQKNWNENSLEMLEMHSNALTAHRGATG